MNIKSFRGAYYYLSNFYEASITYNGITYLNNEAAFQSIKLTNEDERIKFSNLSPVEAKFEGRRVKLRADWEDIKFNSMYEIVKAKFQQNEDIRRKLIATRGCYLEEANTWGDRIWGTVNGRGQNKLGEILMEVREEFIKENVA